MSATWLIIHAAMLGSIVLGILLGILVYGFLAGG